jgi:hypothetical protein
VQNKYIKLRVIIVASSLMLANSAYAFDMGNMMNPSKWTGGNKDKDRYDDYRGGPGYGYGGGPGYSGGPAYGAAGAGSNDAEILQLKERLRQLESGPR